METDGSDALAIGGQTNDPVFMSDGSPSCLSNYVPFVLVQDNSQRNGIRWTKFFGDGSNDTFSDVTAIKYPFDNDEPSDIRSSFFFVVLKNKNNDKNSHKLFALNSNDGSYQHEGENGIKDDIPVTLPDALPPNNDQILAIYSKDSQKNSLKSYSALILGQDTLVDEKPFIHRVDFWDSDDIQGSRLNSYASSGSKFPFKSIVNAGDDNIFIGGSISYCPLLMRIQHDSSSGFDFSSTSLKITEAWKMECIDQSPYFQIDKLVTDYDDKIKLFSLMSPRDNKNNLIEETYFLIMLFYIKNYDDSCYVSKTFKVSPDGTTAHYMRIISASISSGSNTISTFVSYQDESSDILVGAVSEIVENSFISNYDTCSENDDFSNKKVDIYTKGSPCASNLVIIENQCKVPVIIPDNYEKEVSYIYAFSLNNGKGAITKTGDDLEIFSGIDNSISTFSSFSSYQVISNPVLTLTLDCTSLASYSTVTLSSTLYISKSAPATSSISFDRVSTSISSCDIDSHVLSLQAASYEAVDGTIFQISTTGNKVEVQVNGQNYIDAGSSVHQIYVLGVVPQSNPVSYQPYQGQVAIALKNCGEEVITASQQKFSVVMAIDANPVTFDWVGTTDIYCASNNCSTSYGEFPYFLSSIDETNGESCEVKYLQAFTTSLLDVEFTGDSSLSISIDNNQQQPIVSFQIDASSPFKQNLFFKGKSDTGQFEKTEIEIAVCGNEQFTVNSQAKDEWEMLTYDYVNNKISQSDLLNTANFDAGQNSHDQCREQLLSLWTDDQCTIAIDNSGPVISHLMDSADPHVQVNLNTTMNEQSYYVKHSAKSDQTLCKEIKIKVVFSCPKVNFATTSVQKTILIGSGVIDIDLTNIELSGEQTNCTLQQVSIRSRINDDILYADLNTQNTQEFVSSLVSLDDGVSPTKLKFYSDNSDLQVGTLNFLLMFKVSDNNIAFLEFSISVGCQPIYFEQAALIPWEVTLNKGKTKFDLRKYEVQGISSACPIDEVQITVRLKGQSKFPIEELLIEQTKVHRASYISLDNYQIPKYLTIDSSSKSLKEGLYQLLFKQQENSFAFLEFDITLVEESSDPPFFHIPILDEFIAMEEALIEEEEILKEEGISEEILEEIIEEQQQEEKHHSRPLTEEEIEEMMSQAPKKHPEGHVAIGPWKPDWWQKASEEDAQKFLEKLKPKIVDPPEEKIPVKLTIGKISRKGMMEIKFNQKMIPPKFEDEKRLLLSSKRQLLKKSDLDVSRDILDISFQSNHEGSHFVRYVLEISEWNEDLMVIHINFTNPMAVSNGEYRDKIVVKVMNPAIFVSAVSGETLENEFTQLDVSSFPRQLPNGVSEEELKENAEAAASSLQSLIIVQIILQVFLKGSIDDVWNLYLMLQLIAMISLYDTPISSNVEIYMDEFRNLVFFDILQPDKIIGIFYPGVTLQSLLENELNSDPIPLTGSMESSGVKSSGFIVNMAVYILVLAMFLFCLIFAFALSFIPMLRQKMKQIIKKTLDKTFWNNTIRSVTLSYIETAKTFHIQASLEKKQGNPYYLVKSWSLFFFLFGYPLICAIVMLRMRNILEDQIVKDRIEQMYKGVSLWRHKYTVLYYPVFMYRRLLFIMIPVVIDHPAQQIQLLCFFSSLYIISYGQLWSHIEQSTRFFELFNEACFMLFNYHMFAFATDYIDDDTKHTQFKMGWSFIFSIACLILVNIVYILYRAVKKAFRQCELKNMKKAFKQRQIHQAEMNRIAQEEYQANLTYEQRYGFDKVVKKKSNKKKNKVRLETIQEVEIENTQDELVMELEKELQQINQTKELEEQ